jgi:molybdenum-dependent DNA-binding transcriptional regulator ModE
MARETGHLKKMGNISVYGTRIHANASKHSAVSYKRAVQIIEEAEREVKELIGKAEKAGRRP